jgi:hypothetical protein
VLVVFTLLLLQGASDRAVLADIAAPTYHIWTPGTLNGVTGQYHMAGLGLTKSTAGKLLLSTLKQTPSQAEFNTAVSVLAVGTVVFYFRAQGNTLPFPGNERTFLKPVGDIPNLTFADTFAVDKTGDITIPCIDHNQVTVCNEANVCTPGVLGHGGIVHGDSLNVEVLNDGSVLPRIKLYRITTGGAKEYLTMGPNLCPYTGAETSVTARCSTLNLRLNEVGGPRIPRTGTTTGDIFYLERE